MHDTVSRIMSEGPQGLAALAKQYPCHRRAGSLTPQALWRWATRGIKTPDGRTVRLEVIKLAGRYLSSAKAVERFITSQSEGIPPIPLPTPSRSPSKRQRAATAAAEMLAEVGI
jgi:hypothetical protein